MKANELLIGIAIGLRARPNFGLEDKIGEIIDAILFSKKSYFSPDVFLYTNNGVGEKRLYNPETNDQLTITNSDVILDINFAAEGGFNKEDESKILIEFRNTVLKNIESIYSIKEINRLGVVRKHIISNSLYDKKAFISNICEDYEGVDEFTLNFQKRMPKLEAITQSDINDYRNAIYIIKKRPGNDDLFISIDYQNYFDPPVHDLSDLEYEKTVGLSTDYYNNTFSDWFNKRITGEKK